MGSNYTTSTAFLEALNEAGVSYIFANFGSDHPAMIEALATAKKEGRSFPKIITSPHEFVAISAAQGYAQVTGEPQAVVVHVECGTQNLGGGLHNAFKGRVPILLFAGASPYSQEGELLGSRNEFIQWIQDVHDQRGIVRGYTKYDNEIRSGVNVKQLVHRSLQIAKSGAPGPVYLMGAREVMEEETKPVSINTNLWEPMTPLALPQPELQRLAKDIEKAEKPLIVTSYLGRDEEAVKELADFSEKLAIPVLQSVPSYMNFSSDHPMHVGIEWNTKGQNELLAEADLVLVFDSDIPWIQLNNKPSDDSIIYYFDIDPLKEEMPLWYIPSKRFFATQSRIVLEQLNNYFSSKSLKMEKIESRFNYIKDYHNQMQEELRKKETFNEEVITPEYLTACIREAIDEDTVVLNEGISNYKVIYSHMKSTQPGSIISSGAGSLGWNGGAAFGVKLALKDKTIVNLTGDGSYMFSIPSTVHWLSRRYEAPFLTVIYNNRGWKSPKQSTLGVHPNGIANELDEYWVDFTPHADLAKIAEAAGGAMALTVKDPKEVKEAIKKALEAVKSGQSAVLDVYLPAVKQNSKSDEKAQLLLK